MVLKMDEVKRTKAFPSKGEPDRMQKISGYLVFYLFSFFLKVNSKGIYQQGIPKGSCSNPILYKKKKK